MIQRPDRLACRLQQQGEWRRKGRREVDKPPVGRETLQRTTSMLMIKGRRISRGSTARFGRPKWLPRQYHHWRPIALSRFRGGGARAELRRRRRPPRRLASAAISLHRDRKSMAMRQREAQSRRLAMGDWGKELTVSATCADGMGSDVDPDLANNARSTAPAAPQRRTGGRELRSEAS